ncbi:MAG: hypothetical protein ACOCQM_00085 [Natronomonas sp.]
MEREDSPDPIDAIRTAEDLEELAEHFGTDSVHEAYFRAKAVWEAAIRRMQASDADNEGLPGTRVVVDGHAFHVHGVTHAGTDEERSFLREHVSAFQDRGAVVYCEQGIRSMYFEDFPATCEMDDYRWAMERCAELDSPSHLEALSESGIDALLENLPGVTETFREATFSLIDSGTSVYGEAFERALGDVAADFLTTHTDLAVGTSYEAFALSNEASRNPERLGDLQRYYERNFLPQPLEREWLRGHDPELEIVTHARNERMADYAVYHNDTADEVHLIVGAAHQPGVVYYLERYREGRTVPDSFDLV